MCRMWRVIKLGGVTRSVERKMASSMNLRLKQRAVIEFLTAEGCNPIEIYSRMKAVYGEMCLDVSTVRRWTRRSREENPSESTVHDQARTGRSLSAPDSKHQSRVDQLIRENRRVKQIDISIEVGIPREGPPHHHKSPRIQESFCSMGPKNADASDETAKSANL
ncbi:transposase [Elysia marginata]|uniref:Transposase n=1 Tax=Elysia marginata TaxID=1093978 RepID=A0AAV4FUZ5_9GAST|nr:transposase [Elysia marginata]